MEVFANIDTINKSEKYTAIALGTFDGIHRGHLDVLQHTIKGAKDSGGKSLVLTFTKHPFAILNPPNTPQMISSLEERRYLLEKIGIDAIMEITLTQAFMNILASEFLLLLVNKIAPAIIVVGENYTYGHLQEGNALILREQAQKYDIKVDICKLFVQNGAIVTSTRIRKLLQTGKLELANELLGHPFIFIGEVVHGDARGRKLGFPTANLDLPPWHCMLQSGIYVVKVHLLKEKSRVFFGLANVGSNPTFGNLQKRLEIYIDDFSRDIYGEKIVVEFLTYLREEKKFSSVRELIVQIQLDVKEMKKTIAHFQ